MRLHLTLLLAACSGKEPTDTADTGPVAEPDPYTLSDGLPDASGDWVGRLQYSYVHPYAWGDGPDLQVERLTADVAFFDAAAWGVFDVMHGGSEGCWTDSWTPGWSEFSDVGETVAMAVGAEAVTLEANEASDGVIYTWRADTPAQAWAITPGAALALDGTDAGVIVPEPLVIVDLATSWVDYDADGTLVIAWEPPTLGTTWIQVSRRETDGRYTRCHVRDDGAVTIQFGSRPDREDGRLSFSRMSSAEVDHPTFGRVSAFAEDLILLDPG